MSTGSVEDIYSDLYSTFSQLTCTTADDIEQLPYSIDLKTSLIFVGSTVGGLLFGYDTGVISGVLLNLKPEDLSRPSLTDFNREIITSITSIGSFLGSIIAFPLADRCGRRITLAICCMVFIISGIWMALSRSLLFLVVGRLIVGIAVGVAAQCTPIYLSEISPANVRGFMLTLNSVAITGGQLLSYMFAFVLRDLSQSWRYLFGISAIPAIMFISLLDFIPESPRWLVTRGKFPEAHSALKMIYPGASVHQINLKLRRLIIDLGKLNHYNDIDEPLLQQSRSFLMNLNSSILSQANSIEVPVINNLVQPSNSYSSLPNQRSSLKRKRHVHKMEARTKRALMVGCTLMFFQQVTGFNAFMYYSPIIFSKLNIQDPLLPAILVAITNFLFTFVALRYVERVGKRSMLLYTVVIMIIGLLLCSTGFEKNNLNLLLTSIVIFVAGYASAMGTVPWSCVEFLPLNRRSFGASCISCTNWLTNAIVSLSYLSIIDKIGDSSTMLIFAMFSTFSWIFIYFCYPEVRGLSLEEIGKIFENGIDIYNVYRNYY
ncbi:Cin10p NDAI_0A04360 [Naumovozyma dairenensis CBS 421]|uniref:Major facilitator superfamily (MFS) profile domain-containing protein n=1 Tax=Naumovozyma dairenensis (strain ATCC 10597 / BCRC 20456 / CBS 421 / NBRC 0211 / NRRL Y-12639) TaxID=1071378 RepID=G0W455_NAUDC|nr:hypothetical protein NDAI_0A04360 [Naumovozyma dairenensis CBS 421]CCD22593.1 hypothetical protein NDAI_0A04360 [Naumovozyma dairenensis CBS 421]